jgi:hypothetical protein
MFELYVVERGLLPKISVIMDLLGKTAVIQSNPPD